MAEVENQGEIPISFASKKRVKPKKQKIFEVRNSEGVAHEVQSASVEPPLEKPLAPEKKPERSKEAILPEQVQMPQKEKVEIPPVQKTKPLEKETVSQSPSNCKYNFGYLSQRKKGEEIPDTCIECSKSLDCMLSNYYKKEESMAEIKKWYHI